MKQKQDREKMKYAWNGPIDFSYTETEERSNLPKRKETRENTAIQFSSRVRRSRIPFRDWGALQGRHRIPYQTRPGTTRGWPQERGIVHGTSVESECLFERPERL